MKWLIVSLIILIAVGAILYPQIKQMFSNDNAEEPSVVVSEEHLNIDKRPKFIPRNQIKLIIAEYIYMKNHTLTDTSLIFIEGLDSIAPIAE